MRLCSDIVGFRSLGELLDGVRKVSPNDAHGFPEGVSVASALKMLLHEHWKIARK